MAPISDCEVRDPRIRRTRKLLQGALESLMQSKSFDEISVQDITESKEAEMALKESLENSLLKLSPDVRRTFLMVFLEELTCRETAALLGIPIGTVLSRLDSARRSLRNAIAAAEAQVSRGQWNRNGHRADTDTPAMKPPTITPKSGRRL